MPIYEFYCSDCHTMFSFLSRSAGTRKRPACPRCGRAGLEKQASAFAIASGRGEAADDPGLAGLDESRVERAMAELAHQAESVGEDDPRAASQLMRKFYEGTGLRMGEGMAEALRRMETGEDPEQIEREMADVLESEDALFAGSPGGLNALRKRLRAPSIDRTLYEL